MTTWTQNKLPTNGEEGDAFEYFNCRACAYDAAGEGAAERGDDPRTCNVLTRALCGLPCPEIVCAEIPGAWPYGRAFRCLACEAWRVPIPQGEEREALRLEAAEHV
ncbi:MAG TPA: hypothetical protein VM283_10030 [Armatimonadota bacterium]|nr:hypothetical protein [Armatimonadota bacterium]